MNELNEKLLFSAEIQDVLLSSPIVGPTPRGSYNPMQFVLRLRDDIHFELKSIKPGIRTSGSLSESQILAFSTFLHENIHWWQHVGSNFGFISSLKFPAQAHIAYKDLKYLIEHKGAFKSILNYNKAINEKLPKESNQSVNRILNYWHDLEIANLIAIDPSLIRRFITNPYFDTVGHSYHMMWSTAIQTLAATIDPSFSFLPKVEKWTLEFEKLKTNKVRGFYLESSIGIPPIGAKAIYEGQARFSQLQYLFYAFEGKYDINDFANWKMLHGIYVEAINHFLKILDEPMPDKANHSLIGLFLLICDIAINPVDGFPIELYNYESFIISNDPGHRFCLLCEMVKNKHPELKSAIQEYSKTEYINVSKILSESIVCFSPYEGMCIIKDWIENQIEIKELLIEESAYKYNPRNLPVRLFFSKYLRFQEDKFEQPQFFCWPGLGFIEHSKNELHLTEVESLFNRHLALFVNNIGGGVYPMLFECYEETQINSTFNDFYVWNSSYDMIRNWITQNGPFKFDYKWLSSSYNQAEIESWICRNFEDIFKVNPKDFKII